MVSRSRWLLRAGLAGAIEPPKIFVQGCLSLQGHPQRLPISAAVLVDPVRRSRRVEFLLAENDTGSDWFPWIIYHWLSSPGAGYEYEAQQLSFSHMGIGVCQGWKGGIID